MNNSSNQLTSPMLSRVKNRNFFHLYGDVFWWGVLAGSSISFLPIFLARLGASSFQIGLLTAGPAIINLVFSLPSGRWLASKPFLRTTFLSSIWHRLGYILLIFLPFFFAENAQISGMLAASIVMSIPGTLLAISFNAAFAEIVPPDDRALVVGRRNALVSLSMVATSVVCGQILELDWLAFPLNYQIVFGLGALGAGLSTYHLGQLKLTPDTSLARVNRPFFDTARPGVQRFFDAFRYPQGLRFLTRSTNRTLLELRPLRGPYGWFMFSYLAFYTFQYTAIPIFPTYFVSELKLGDASISIGTALFHFAMFLASFGLHRVSKRLGNRRMLFISAFIYGLYPLLNGMAQGVELYLIASFVGGIVWGFANGGLINRLMERIPEDQLPSHMAIHNLVLNLGILTGSLLSPLLIHWTSLREAMYIAAALRFLGGIFLGIWG
jgi:MFS family permease